MKKMIFQMLVFTASMLTFSASYSQNKAMTLLKNQPDGVYALITTQRGDILLFLETEKAPVTSANFIGLAEGKIHNTAKGDGVPFFDGLTFHRVEPGFVIQGGDPQGNGQGGPGYQFDNEIDPSLKHDKAGILAMANAGPNTNGCQFYITLKATPFLDGHYSVFGHVVDGQSVVDSIKKGDVMTSVKILRKGAAAEKFDAAKVFSNAHDDQAQKAAVKAKEAAAQAAIQAKADEAKIAEYKGKAKTTPSGLMYIIEKEGTGKNAAAGDTVSVHYTGYLLDGKKFDSSVDRGQPISFPLGQHRVIPGWDEGIALLKTGGKAKLIIPPGLAYGSQGAGGVIPPNATLVFDVELVSIASPGK